MHAPACMDRHTCMLLQLMLREWTASICMLLLLLLRACVRARLRMPVWSTVCISWVFYSSAQTQQAWRIEFSYRNIDVFWKSSRHLSIGRARDAASRATRGFPKHDDICIRNHVWTKCTFGYVLYLIPCLIPLLIDGLTEIHDSNSDSNGCCCMRACVVQQLVLTRSSRRTVQL
jgi:hypothetical protein